MKTLKKYYNLVDKSSWPRGEWDSEPDIVNLFDKRSGLYCQIYRHPSLGTLNGYVALPSYYKEYKKIGYDSGLDCHGGITFSRVCEKEDIGMYVPNIPYENSKLTFWIGFDTAHAWDIIPAHSKLFNALTRGSMEREYYKNIKFVKKELTSLCKQLT